MKRRAGGSVSWSTGLGLAAALGALLLGAGGCGGPEDADTIEVRTSALTGQDVMGFETLDSWTPASGTEALTTTRTQGAFAYALTAPVNFTFINSANVESTTPNLQGIGAAGSSFALDFIIPPQQPNPFFFGSLQLLVTVPSRNVNNEFLGQVELTGRPTGVFQILRFPINQLVRSALAGQTFSDLRFTLALNAPSGATGTYIFDNLRVVAGAGNADFTLTPNPASVAVTQGGTATSTIAIARTGGFTSSVAFSASGLPAGVTASFAPAATTGGSTVVTFAAAAGATVGPATVLITGTGGGLSRTATITLNVNAAPNFALSPNPANVTVVQGATATSTIAIARTGGFAASVAFSAGGLPAGVTATFNPAATTGNTTVVTFTAAATATVGGPTAVTITGVGGGLTRTTTINLTVNAAPNFALGANPAAVTVVQGATATSTITITRTGGFAASVAFSASGLPAGVTATFNPAATTGNTTVVTFTAAPGATVGGPTTVTITGVGGGLTRTTAINLTVAAAPDFTLAADPASVSVQVGGSASSTVQITRANGFVASVAFAASGLPAGVTAAFDPAATAGDSTVVTFTASDTALVGSAPVTITGTGGGLTRTTTIEVTVVAAGGNFALSASPQAVPLVQGQTNHSFIVIERFEGFASTVAFSASGLPAGVTAVFTPAATAGDATTLALSASPTAALGFGQVLVTATGGGLVRTLTLDIFVRAPAPDFALSASGASVALPQGSSAQSFISIARIDGFADTVAFSASGLPAGVTASFDPASTTGDSTTLTLTASATAATGFATITVSGAGGGLTRTVTIGLSVSEAAGGDFAISASPGGLTLNPGEPAQTFIAISRSGFGGAVSFSVTSLPAGVTATFEPPSTTGDATVLTLTAAPGAPQAFVSVDITGTGGGLTRTTTIFLFVNGV